MVPRLVGFSVPLLLVFLVGLYVELPYQCLIFVFVGFVLYWCLLGYPLRDELRPYFNFFIQVFVYIYFIYPKKRKKG